ncbi:MAG: YihY/virulence factor BrkB family protein [Chloroflexi bacterium]|nr:YihY/virulence factor BrkB family protein [Chloroflexota bacterium]
MVERWKRLLEAADGWAARWRTTRVGRRAVAGFALHDGPSVASSMAYFAILSLFQVIVLGVIVFSLLIGEGEARRIVIGRLESALPLEAGTVTSVVESIIESRGGVTIVSVPLLAWGAIGFFGALSTGVGRAFATSTRRPFWQDKLIALFLLGGSGLLTLISVGIGLGERIAARLAGGIPGGSRGSQLLVDVVGFAVPILLVLVALVVIYRVVPNRSVTVSQVLPGAIVATLLFTALRSGFTWYATDVARYESFFGPISTVISLLVFLHFASMVVLLGAEIARANVLEDDELMDKKVDS